MVFIGIFYLLKEDLTQKIGLFIKISVLQTLAFKCTHDLKLLSLMFYKKLFLVFRSMLLFSTVNITTYQHLFFFGENSPPRKGPQKEKIYILLFPPKKIKPKKKRKERRKNCTFCPFLSVLVSLLLSASVERFSVSCMHDFHWIGPTKPIQS